MHLSDITLQLLENALWLHGYDLLRELESVDIVHNDVRSLIDDEDILYPRNGFSGVSSDVFNICRLWCAGRGCKVENRSGSKVTHSHRAE
jgi:hypothetical protein